MYNPRMKFAEIWKILTFFSNDYSQQKNLIGIPCNEYGYYDDRLSSEGNYVLQITKMFLYNTFSDFFPHMKSIPTINNDFSGSLEELCLFIYESIYKQGNSLSDNDIAIFEINELEDNKIWDFVRTLAKDGLKEVELFPLELEQPIKIFLPDYMYPSPIYNRQSIF